MKNIHHDFSVGSKKMREYHIDSHPSFCEMTPQLSIRRNPNNRPLLMIGQDECVFKQYSFSKKCWKGPGGEFKLLPKTDGCSKMISGFVSRDFGLGLTVTATELTMIYERRSSPHWGEYLSEQAAIEIYGCNHKMEIEDKHTLLRFFDVGVNEDGYWNYNHMALQVEDVFDILSVKYPDYDFL